MSKPEEYDWKGVGRWLSFGVAAAMVVISVPQILTNVAAGGWTIFLGLLLFGAIASGNRHAPNLATVLMVLFAIRGAVALTFGADIVAAMIEGAFSVAMAVAARDLRRQKMAILQP